MNAPGKPAVTALIADDEPHLAKHLASRLAALWPELDLIATAANGLEAFELIEALRPDIAFLDIRMPGLSGLDVAARLTAPCRLVFVTAYDQYAVEAFEREAVDYLLKPINDTRLQKTIERLRASLMQPAAALPQALLAQLQTLVAGAPATSKAAPLRWIKAQVGPVSYTHLRPISQTHLPAGRFFRIAWHIRAKGHQCSIRHPNPDA